MKKLALAMVILLALTSSVLAQDKDPKSVADYDIVSVWYDGTANAVVCTLKATYCSSCNPNPSQNMQPMCS